MYCDNQKQIEKEKSLTIEKLSLLGYTNVRCYFSNIGVDKFFTVRAECVPGHNSGLFGECSYECRQKSDHDSNLCALNSLLKKANNLKEILIRGKARDSAASLLSYLCELPYDSDVEKAIEKVNEVIDFVLGIRDESI